jgi:YVTN family beta-propeller protein
VIHTPTSTLGAPIPVAAATTGAVTVSSDGRTVYVGTSNAVSVIDTLANAVIATIPISASPISLALRPYGRKLYVVTANAVLVSGTGTGTVIGTIPVGATSAVAALNGLYVPQAPNSVLAFEADTYALIDTITLQPLDCK